MKKFKTQLFELDFDSKEKDIINKTLDSRWIASGQNTLLLEEKFNNLLKNRYSLAVSSCTSAIHLSLLSLDLKKGDEVMLSVNTFICSANVIKMCSATPIFLDVTSKFDLNVSLSEIRKKVTKKTKAIIYVHFGGTLGNDIEKIYKFCLKKKIKLIEDVAHSPMAMSIKSKNYAGSFSDFSCFSFYSNKNISAGEGGLLSIKSKGVYEKIKRLRSHGMTVSTLDRHNGRAITYDIKNIGLNYRITELAAGLACIQFTKCYRGNLKRKKIFNLYEEYLSKFDIYSPLKYKNSIGSYHIAVFVLPKKINRNKLILYLKNNDIQTSIHYPPFWKFSAYKNLINKKNYPIYTELADRIITFPLHVNLTPSHIKHLSKQIKYFLSLSNG